MRFVRPCSAMMPLRYSPLVDEAERWSRKACSETVLVGNGPNEMAKGLFVMQGSHLREVSMQLSLEYD